MIRTAWAEWKEWRRGPATLRNALERALVRTVALFLPPAAYIVSTWAVRAALRGEHFYLYQLPLL